MRTAKYPEQQAAKTAFFVRGITYSDVAEAVDSTASTVSMKMNGISEFTTGEVRSICDRFGIDPLVFIYPDRCEKAIGDRYDDDNNQ